LNFSLNHFHWDLTEKPPFILRNDYYMVYTKK
jgi:hypothetical protein